MNKLFTSKLVLGRNNKFSFLSFNRKLYDFAREEEKSKREFPLCKKSHRSYKSYDEAFSKSNLKNNTRTLLGTAKGKPRSVSHLVRNF